MNIAVSTKYSVLFFLTIMLSHLASAQETVFTIFKSHADKADEYFYQRNYKKAIDLYKASLNKGVDDELYLQIARSYYLLNRPAHAVPWYHSVVEKEGTLPEGDMYKYAEALCATKKYDEAIEWYTRYQKRNPSDPLTIKKIWQLRNREFLYEDSVHYAVRPVDINSSAGEFGAVPYEDGVVFVSNRRRKGLIRNASPEDESFYRVYFSRLLPDTTRQGLAASYGKPQLFCRELNARFHEGSVALYDGNKMLYTSSGSPSLKEKTKRTLQVHFAEQKNGLWSITGSFPFNSSAYSVIDPVMSKDQKTLYFASDMKGGIGGKDIYRSDFVNGQWSKPVNLGDVINTTGDESSPFIDAGDILYFASNGHAGLGGLDIFKVQVLNTGAGEVTNLGYPINTNADDFGIYLDDDGAHGYFTSNRLNENDDIYELNIDMQTYPLVIKGVLKYKAESWKDSSELRFFPDAQLSLMDNYRNIVVGKTVTDASGGFLLTIPYASQYTIKVTDPRSGDEILVGLELSKRKMAENIYEIVVVKNAFRSTIQNGLIK